MNEGVLAHALLSSAALVVHAGWLAAAPVVASVVEQVRLWPGGAAAGIGPGAIEPLRASFARRAPLAPGDDPVRLPAVLAFGAANLAAYLLVPSFAVSMATAPLDDLSLVALLLCLGLVAALIGHSGGGRSGAIPGLAGGQVGLAFLPAPVLLAGFGLALVGGSTALDAAIAAAPRLSPAPLILAIAALCLVAVADLAGLAGLDRFLAGRALALFRLGCAVRLLLWLDLVAAFCPPFTLAGAGAGPLAWALSLAALPVKVGVLAVLLGIARRWLVPGAPGRRRTAYGAATLLGLLSAVFVLIGRSVA